MDKKVIIESGKTALGIEFGSTRVKAVLIDEDCGVLASGSYEWENQLLDGYWTYSIDEIHTRDAYGTDFLKRNSVLIFYICFKVAVAGS